jgi:isocitrate dehydrogenase
MSFHPYVSTKHPIMDVVIVRENEEDLYAGIEHQQTDEVVQCLKLISRPGCEKIVRYAFEYAKQQNRKKVTCFTKDNIMKQTDGLFHQVFDEIAKEYPEIENEHWIVDIGAAKLADTPEAFDVIVMPNLYGDVLSDVAAQIAGSVGLQDLQISVKNVRCLKQFMVQRQEEQAKTWQIHLDCCKEQL